MTTFAEGPTLSRFKTAGSLRDLGLGLLQAAITLLPGGDPTNKVIAACRRLSPRSLQGRKGVRPTYSAFSLKKQFPKPSKELKLRKKQKVTSLKQLKKTKDSSEFSLWVKQQWSAGKCQVLSE